MSRVYSGPHSDVGLRHPVTGRLVVAFKDVPTDELDDIGDVDLGPEWAEVKPAKHTAKADTTTTTTTTKETGDA